MKSNNISAVIVCSILLLTGRSVYAQGAPKSLTEYLSAAMRSNPLLASAAQDRVSAEYSGRSIREAYRPQIGITSHLIVAPGYDPAITNGGELGAQLTASYTLYDGGTSSLEIERGDLGTTRGKLGEARLRADVVYSVSTAYVDAVRQKRELGVIRNEYDLLSDYLVLVKQLHAAGQGSETDVLKTTVDLNNVAVDMSTRRVAYASALLSLAQVCGLPSSEVTDVDTSVVSVSYDSVFNARQNVDLASLDLAQKDAELQARIAGSRLGPTVSVGADAGALTSLPNLQQGLANVFGASVMVSVSMPVFTLGSLEDNYNAAQAAEKSVSLRNRYSRDEVSSEFIKTRNAIAQADSQITALKSNLDIADENLLLTKSRYAGGSGLSLEVLDAIRSVNQIRLSIEEARASRAMSELKLNRLNYNGAD